MFVRSVLTLFFGVISIAGFTQEDHREAYKAKTLEQFPNSIQDFFDTDAKYNVAATYRLKKKGKIIAVPTSADQIKNYREYAEVSFRIDGRKHRLMVYQSVPPLPLYKDHLFLPLKDLTAPAETYGGGRYMDLSLNDFKGGKVQLDFNRLYNPYCAFSDGWSCPIPPKKNHLTFRLEAGEKLPLKTEYDVH